MSYADRLRAEANRQDAQRIITHRQLAPVARLMGFTPGGLTRICSGLMDTWNAIGVTRQEVHPVYACRPKWWFCQAEEFGEECDCIGDIHGTLVFSVGTEQFFDAQAAKLFRQQIERDTAIRIAALLAPRRVSSGVIQERVIKRPVTALVSPYAPRDHRSS